MKICYFHTERAQADFPLAWANATLLRDRYKPAFGFYETHRSSDYSYADALIPLWGNEDLIIMEQDVLASPQMISSLIQCQCRACTYTFKNSAVYGESLALGCRLWDPEGNFLLNAHEKILPNYATFSGVGLVKIGKEFQKVPLHRFAVKTRANGGKGQNADNAILQNINAWANPLGWSFTYHVHGKVEHLHQ